MQNWKKLRVCFWTYDKFWKGHDWQIKEKRMQKRVFRVAIFIPEKYVFRVCFESPFMRMISNLNYKCPPPRQSATPDSEKFVKNQEKEGKNQEKKEKLGRKGKNREGSFTFPFLTDTTGYATEDRTLIHIGCRMLLFHFRSYLRVCCSLKQGNFGFNRFMIKCFGLDRI